MSAADVLSPFGSLVTALVARETDHEHIAAACGVSRTLPHDLRTAAILATLRFYAVSRDAWAREALTVRARVDEIDEARRGAVATRDAWRDLAVAASAGLARVASALQIGPASEHPADAARVAGACVAAAEALTDRPSADTQRAAIRLACGEDHTEPCDALDALADVATALDVKPTNGATADQIVLACLARIEQAHRAAARRTQETLATVDELTRSLSAANTNTECTETMHAAAQSHIEEMVAELALARDERDAAIEALRVDGEYRVRLLEIMRGRTSPPTLAEIDAHGGSWLLTRGTDHVTGVVTATGLRLHDHVPGDRYTPLHDGQPCAWPVVLAEKAAP